ACKWKYCPITDVQVRINPDGTVEASAILRVDRLNGYFRAIGFDGGEVNLALEKLNIAGINPPIYMKGQASVTDGAVDLNFQKVEIGRLPVPDDLVQKYTGVTESFVERNMARVPGLSIKSATFTGGQLNVDGTYPAVESTTHE